VGKFRNTICPPPPQLSLHRRAALSSNSNGTRSVQSRMNTKSNLYCELSMDEPLWLGKNVWRHFVGGSCMRCGKYTKNTLFW
jgi:hypothetical protein